MRFREIGLLIANSIHKETRSRLVIFSTVATLVVIICANYVLHYFSFAGEFPFEQGEHSASLYRFWSMIQIAILWNTLLAAMLGVMAIRGDFDFKIIGQILSLPVTRLDYFISRLAGAWLIAMAHYLVSLYLVFTLYSLGGNPFPGFTTQLAAHLGEISMVLLSYILLALLFSLFLPRVIAFLFTTILLYLGSMANQFFTLSQINQEAISKFDLFNWGAWALHSALPRTGYFKSSAISRLTGEIIPFELLPEMLHYGVTMTILGALAYLVFSRKEI